MFSDRKSFINAFIKNLHVTWIPWNDNIYFMKWHKNKTMLVLEKVTADVMQARHATYFL